MTLVSNLYERRMRTSEFKSHWGAVASCPLPLMPPWACSPGDTAARPAQPHGTSWARVMRRADRAEEVKHQQVFQMGSPVPGSNRLPSWEKQGALLDFPVDMIEFKYCQPHLIKQRKPKSLRKKLGPLMEMWQSRKKVVVSKKWTMILWKWTICSYNWASVLITGLNALFAEII